MRRLALKEGVILTSDHFRPDIAIMVQVVLEEAPDTDDGLIWITSAFRPASIRVSYHPAGAAFDFRVKNIKIPDDITRRGGARDESAGPDRDVYIRNTATDWRARVQRRLGRQYDTVLHGPALHLHVEKNSNPPLQNRNPSLEVRNEWTKYKE